MRVAVVGGGIAGLAAALRLRDRLGPSAQITVYEQAGVPGGKLRTGEVAGLTAELGADAFLTGGEAVALADRLGLPLVHPQPVPPALVLAGQLRPVPGGTLIGVPGDLAAVAAIARPAADRDRDQGVPLLAAGEDVTVGELVRRRLGDEVVDRLVDPMLGGVYAGRADSLSLAATMPALAAACRTSSTLVDAVRAARAARLSPGPSPALPPASGASAPAPDKAPGPVFGSVRGGLGRLVEAVAAESKATLRLGLPVRSLTPDTSGWRVVVGSTRDSSEETVDGVVLAVPARPAARLLGFAPGAAELVGALDYASVALVTLVFPADTALPHWSGFLVPATGGTAIKAATFVSRKWGHAPGDPVLVRLSVGRYGEPEPLRLTDDALAVRAHDELAGIVGDLPACTAWRVQRWGGALPQYAPGHLDRVAAARAAQPGSIGLAGAGFDGVGIPACIRSGQSAADAVVAALEG
jgi:oxygen-dependent protoporphyrinogen oxidase